MSVTRWDSIHREAFIPWVNLRLAAKGKEISNISHDFSDGLVLIALLEVLSGKRIRRYSKRPRNPIQQVDNVCVALDFLSDEMGLRILGCNPQEIVDGNEKQILGLLFLLSQYDKRRDRVDPSITALPRSASHIYRRNTQYSKSLKERGNRIQSTHLEDLGRQHADAIPSPMKSLTSLLREGEALGAGVEGDEKEQTDCSATTAGEEQSSGAAEEAGGEREEDTADDGVVAESLETQGEEQSRTTAEPSQEPRGDANTPAELQLTNGATATDEDEQRTDDEQGGMSDSEVMMLREGGAIGQTDDEQEEEDEEEEESAQEIRDKNDAKRKTVAEELLLTEKSYVEGLQTLIQTYMKPLMERELISALEIRNLFSVVEALLGCNQELLQSLTDRMEKWDEEDGRISDIFLQLVPYLRMYTQYVNNLNVAMTTLDECKRKSKQFVAFLDTKLKTTKGLDIGSFLIMPVQRIPRYVLLLKELLKYTSTDHSDYGNLRDAVAQMEEVATYVNEKKREAESLNQVLSVQGRLTGKFENLTTSTRRYVHEGPLLDMSDADKKNRYLILFNDCIIITATPNWSKYWKEQEAGGEFAKDGGLKFKDTIFLDRGSLSEPADALQSMDAKFKCMFQLSAPKHNKTFTFQAPTYEEKMRWLIHLDDCFSQLLDAARSRAFSSLEEYAKRAKPGGSDVMLRKDLMLRNDMGEWESRRFVLTKCYMSHWKEGEEESTRRDINILLSPCKIATPMDRPYTFAIFEATDIHYLAASSGEEMFQWITAIRNCTSSALKAIGRATRQAKRPWPAELQSFAGVSDNLACADCGTDGTSFVSLTFGVFLCDDCTNAHRILGTNVKSLKYSGWKPEHVQMLEGKGNNAVNEQFLKNVPDYMDSPSKTTSFEMRLKFVRAKYLGEVPERDRVSSSTQLDISSVHLEGGDVSSEVSSEAGEASTSTEAGESTDDPATPKKERRKTYRKQVDSGAVELYDATKEVWSNRWMKLEKYTIRFYNREKSSKPRASVQLETCSVKRSLKHDSALDLVTPAHIYTFRSAEWPSWMECIEAAKAARCASLTPKITPKKRRMSFRRSKRKEVKKEVKKE